MVPTLHACVKLLHVMLVGIEISPCGLNKTLEFLTDAMTTKMTGSSHRTLMSTAPATLSVPETGRRLFLRLDCTAAPRGGSPVPAEQWPQAYLLRATLRMNVRPRSRTMITSTPATADPCPNSPNWKLSKYVSVPRTWV